jgi:hypothetical protein
MMGDRFRSFIDAMENRERERKKKLLSRARCVIREPQDWPDRLAA